MTVRNSLRLVIPLLLVYLFIKLLMGKVEFKQHHLEEYFQGTKSFQLVPIEKSQETKYLNSQLPYVKISPQKKYYRYLNIYENVKLLLKKETIANLLAKKVSELVSFGPTMNKNEWQKVLKRYGDLMKLDIRQNQENIEQVNYVKQREIIVAEIYNLKQSPAEIQELLTIVDGFPWPKQVNIRPFSTRYSLKEVSDDRAWGTYSITFADGEDEFNFSVNDDADIKSYSKDNDFDLTILPGDEILTINFLPSPLESQTAVKKNNSKLAPVPTPKITLKYKFPLQSLTPEVVYHQTSPSSYTINLKNVNSQTEKNFIQNLPKNWMLQSKQQIDSFNTELKIVYAPIAVIDQIMFVIFLLYLLVLTSVLRRHYDLNYYLEIGSEMANNIDRFLINLRWKLLALLSTLVILDFILLPKISDYLICPVFGLLFATFRGFKLANKPYVSALFLLSIVMAVVPFKLILYSEKLSIYVYLLLLISHFWYSKNKKAKTKHLKKISQMFATNWSKLVSPLRAYFSRFERFFLGQVFQTTLVIFIFTLIPILILKGLLFSPGSIMGSDWALPQSKVQIDQNFKNSLYTWSDQGNLFGFRQSTFNTSPFIFLVKILTTIGLPGDWLTKCLLVFSFGFSGLSMFYLLSFFKLKKIPSILGGIIYITTPIFFNYAIMGWMFVLFVMSAFPWTIYLLITAVNKQNLKAAAVLGIICALAIVQSQSMVWIMILFLAFSVFLIKSRVTLFYYVVTVMIAIAIFFLINFYWIIGLILIPDKNISSSNIMDSAVSLGMIGNFKPLYFVRLFGSLSNFPYELAAGASPNLGESLLSMMSFILPGLAISSLFLKKDKKLIRTLWLIALFPMFLYFLNNFRHLLVRIPLINIIRDFNRFITISSFAYTTLVAIVLNHLYLHRQKIFWLVVITISLSLYPWWTGEIVKWENKTDGDMRMRVKDFPDDYYDLENQFQQQKLIQNAIFFPTNLILNFKEDPKFHGSYNEMVDVFAAYSPISGGIYLTDRSNGYLNLYLQLLNQTINTNLDDKLLSSLRLSNIRFLVIKKDVLIDKYEQLQKIFDGYENKQTIKKYFESKNILVYEILDFYPRIYPSNFVIESDQEISTLIDRTEDVVIFSQQNSKIDLTMFNHQQKKPPIIEYKRINPTKYQVVIHQATGPFALVLNQAFHDGWHAYPSKKFNLNSQDNWPSTWSSSPKKREFISAINKNAIQNDNLHSSSVFTSLVSTPITNENHLLANAWSNTWLINPNDFCSQDLCQKKDDGSVDFELILEFYPQRVLILGSGISLITLIVITKYLLARKK